MVRIPLRFFIACLLTPCLASDPSLAAAFTSSPQRVPIHPSVFVDQGLSARSVNFLRAHPIRARRFENAGASALQSMSPGLIASFYIPKTTHALTPFWSSLIFIASAFSEGGIVGQVAYASHGSSVMAATIFFAVATLHSVYGVVRWDRTEHAWRPLRLRREDWKSPSWEIWRPVLVATVVGSSSLVSFLMATDGDSLRTVIAAAVAPHLLLNLAISRLVPGSLSLRYEEDAFDVLAVTKRLRQGETDNATALRSTEAWFSQKLKRALAEYLSPARIAESYITVEGAHRIPVDYSDFIRGRPIWAALKSMTFNERFDRVLQDIVLLANLHDLTVFMRRFLNAAHLTTGDIATLYGLLDHSLKIGDGYYPGLFAPDKSTRPDDDEILESAWLSLVARYRHVGVELLWAFLEQKSFFPEDLLLLRKGLPALTKNLDSSRLELQMILASVAFGTGMPEVIDAALVITPNLPLVVQRYGIGATDMAFLELASFRDDIQMIHAMQLLRDVPFPEHEGRLFQDPTGFIIQNGKPFLVRFNDKLDVDYQINLFTVDRPTVEPQTIDVPHVPQPGTLATDVLLNSKFMAHVVFDNHHLSVPKTLLLRPLNVPVSEAAVRKAIVQFLDDHSLSLAVVKPNSGSQGDGVVIFSRDRLDAAVSAAVNGLNRGKTMLIQEAIVPPMIVRNGKHLGWNLRVMVSWDPITGKAVASDAFIVRYGDFDDAINISKGADVMTYEELAQELDWSDEDRDRLHAQVKTLSESALRFWDAAMRRRYKYTKRTLDLMGVDVIVRLDHGVLSPSIIEANSWRSGGVGAWNNHVQATGAHERRGEPFTVWLNWIALRAQRHYHSNAPAPTVSSVQVPREKAAPKNEASGPSVMTLRKFGERSWSIQIAAQEEHLSFLHRLKAFITPIIGGRHAINRLLYKGA